MIADDVSYSTPVASAGSHAPLADAILAGNHRLLRIIGEPESGRTGLALAVCLPQGSDEPGAVLIVDTLGHGPPRDLPAGRDVVHIAAVDLDEAFFAIRRLLATRAISAVILDDVLGFDVSAGEGTARLQRLRLIQARVQALASLCLGRSARLVILDRLSPMGVQRSPLGFTDIVLAPVSSGISRNRAA